MVIRKLFGSAFAGTDLTDKAISADATRGTTEVHEYIQSGIDDLSLDVDGDSKVTAFGDGLMVIRKLFGSAFSGTDLTDKAISADATRTTEEIHAYIEQLASLEGAITPPIKDPDPIAMPAYGVGIGDAAFAGETLTTKNIY